MHDEVIINAVTQSEPRDAADFRRILRIAVLTARLDEWNHIPPLTAARNRARMTSLYRDLQELQQQRSPSPFTERG